MHFLTLFCVGAYSSFAALAVWSWVNHFIITFQVSAVSDTRQMADCYTNQLHFPSLAWFSPDFSLQAFGVYLKFCNNYPLKKKNYVTSQSCNRERFRTSLWGWFWFVALVLDTTSYTVSHVGLRPTMLPNLEFMQSFRISSQRLKCWGNKEKPPHPAQLSCHGYWSLDLMHTNFIHLFT